MTQCHICGRGMPGTGKANSMHTPHVLPICGRAACEPEQELHGEVMNWVHHTYWPILWGMERKVKSEEAV